MLDHTVSNYQFALGRTRNISHDIAFVCDAIWSANCSKQGSAIADLDFMSAFDLICMDCVFVILKKKGMNDEVKAANQEVQRVNGIGQNNAKN